MPWWRPLNKIRAHQKADKTIINTKTKDCSPETAHVLNIIHKAPRRQVKTNLSTANPGTSILRFALEPHAARAEPHVARATQGSLGGVFWQAQGFSGRRRV